MVLALLGIASLCGYLLGALPVGLVVGRLYRGIDIRAYGSHRTGATNVLRILGPGAAVLVACGDVAKGALAVMAAQWLFRGQPSTFLHVAEVLGGLAALAGHNWSIFTGWTGGRGVLVSVGVLLLLQPPIAVVACLGGLAVIALSRFVSLGSIVGTVVAAAALLALVSAGLKPPAYAAYAVIASAVIILQHRDNIERLRAGTERKLGQRVPAPPPGGMA